MVWAESWCDVGNIVVSVVVCISGWVGGIFAYRKWRHERDVERADTLKTLLEDFDSSKLCELVNSLDSEGGTSEWFARLKEKDEQEVMKSFRLLSYICYLHEKKLISEAEFVLFESQIKAVLMDDDARKYLTNTSVECEDDPRNGQFSYLIRYAQSIDANPVRIPGIDFHPVENQVEKQSSVLDGGTEIDAKEFVVPTAIIKINQKFRDGMTRQELYEATHGWWRVKKDSVDKIKLVLSVADGRVKAAYRVFKWDYQQGNDEGRMAFEGEMDAEANAQFINRSVRNLFPKGAANPIRYFGV